MDKKKRGTPTKNCTGCGNKCHARVSKCKGCGYQFYVTKSKMLKEMAANWRELQSGDVIKCMTGSGPYFLSKERVGEKIYMGHKGTFEVEEIIYTDKNNCGIMGRKLFPAGRKAFSREYIYMGEPYYDENLSIHREPHRIKVIKKRG